MTTTEKTMDERQAEQWQTELSVIAWTPAETLYGRQCAHADWPAMERRLLGDMAKEAYIRELARLLDVEIEVTA